jgi:hypothetical protein
MGVVTCCRIVSEFIVQPAIYTGQMNEQTSAQILSNVDIFIEYLVVVICCSHTCAFPFMLDIKFMVNH